METRLRGAGGEAGGEHPQGEGEGVGQVGQQQREQRRAREGRVAHVCNRSNLFRSKK